MLLGMTVVPSNFSTFSKCFRAFLMFTRVAAEAACNTTKQYIILHSQNAPGENITNFKGRYIAENDLVESLV